MPQSHIFDVGLSPPLLRLRLVIIVVFNTIVCTKDLGTKVPSGISRFVYPTRGHPSRSAYRTPVTAIMEWPHQRYKTRFYPDKQYKKYKRDSIIEFSREGRAFSSDFLIFCLDFMNFTGVVTFLF